MNRGHVKITYLLTAREPARGVLAFVFVTLVSYMSHLSICARIRITECFRMSAHGFRVVMVAQWNMADHYSFVVSVLTLIPTQLAPLPPPSFTPNSITVILSTTTYLSLSSPASNRFRPLLPALLLKRLNAVTSLLSYTVFIVSK